MPPGGSPPVQSRGQNQKWPTSGSAGYITHAAWRVPTTSEQGAESEVAHKWAGWLHNPCRLGVPNAGGRISSGSSQKWKILFFRGHATQSGGGNIKNSPQVGQWQSEVEKTLFLGK